jgi:phosphohistidine phosphatase
MEIFILRHGDANSDSKKIINDSKRSLTDTGIKEIENVSRFFEELDIEIAQIFTSPLRRAKQTAQIILNSQKKAKLVELADLKPEGTPDEVCKKIIEQNDPVILIVGHNPLLIDIINYITSQHKQLTSNFSLKTGGLAKIKTTSSEPKLQGQLEWLLSPKLIRKVSK